MAAACPWTRAVAELATGGSPDLTLFSTCLWRWASERIGKRGRHDR
jgi:hypothetical protein